MITAADFLKWLEIFNVQYGPNTLPIPVPIADGGTGVTSVTVAPTASMWAGWDVNKNLSANNFLQGYTSTVTAASTTTLTVGSTYSQFFTGTTTQTVKMPVSSTLVLGQPYRIVNNSTGNVTVESSGTNTIQVMAPGTVLTLTCISLSVNTAAAWSANYSFQNPTNTFLPLAGGTMTGPINMGSQAITALLNPVNPQDAVTLSYLETFTGAYLPLAGGTMTGQINMGSQAITALLNPVNPQDAVTLSYLETFAGAYLPLAGGTMTGQINAGGLTLTNLADPVNLQDAATKNYVNSIAGGLNPIDGAYGASTANLTGYTYNNGTAGVGATLTAGSNGVFTQDGVSPPVGSRWLYKNDTDNAGVANGIYTVTTSTGGSPAVLTRATDYNTPGAIKVGDLISVEFGTANGTSSWYQTATVVTIGISTISFSVWFNPASYVSNSLPTGTIFIGNGSGLAVPTTATYPATTTVNQLLYSSATNVIAGLSTAISSVLSTNGSGVPGFSTTLPSGLTIPGYATSGANTSITSLTGLTGHIAQPSAITDSSGNVLVSFTYEANAVNYLVWQNGAAGNPVTLSALGASSTVMFQFQAKGGIFAMYDSLAASSGVMRFYNAAATQYTQLGVATAAAASLNLNLPSTDAATAHTPLSSDGSGNLSFSNTPFLGAATATSINFGDSTLSTYKQGTWTPVLTSSGGGTATYNVQSGTYTKIGNRVLFELFLNLTGLPAAGTLTITGLPYTSTAYAAVSMNGILGSTATTMISGQIAGGAAFINLLKYAAGVQANMATSDITSSSQFIMSGQYYV